MDAVLIDGENGRSLSLSNPGPRDGDNVWAYDAFLQLEAGSMRTRVWDDGAGVASYFRSLAEDWQGFDERREFTALEGQLWIRSVHDQLGTVTCTVTLRRPEPPTWTLSAELLLGAGAHLERIASDLERFVIGRR
jgi:hypothetical protein